MEVTIDHLGRRGDGVARGPDGPLYAPLTLPGETVSGTPDGDRLEAPRILAPSPDRVRAACRHFGSCGGCALMHGSDAFVAGWKRDLVLSDLARAGVEMPEATLVTSPPSSRRRATLSGRRTKKGAMVGFHARRSDAIVEIPDCRVLSPALMAALPAAERLTRAGASRKSALSLTLAETLGGVDVAVTGGKPLDAALRLELTAIAAEVPLARLAWEGEVLIEPGRAAVPLAGVAVVPPPGAFLQATSHGEAALQQAVLRAVPGAGRVVDLFSGCGTLALALARGAEVHAVEGDGAMLTALDRGRRHAQGLRPVTTETRDLFRRPLNAEELARFDAAVLDPPRAGAAAQVAEIAASALSRLAYVSCSPSSFARDAAVLSGAGFRMTALEIVDQFRWSPHVELASAWQRD